ncbi:hypothetical protein [Reichenbachiella sp. MALMAid0571]|uniref:hypothetical protein n=1 Tax=Reichenbachiella sp. MALMAid0571 TaxID=3143939 RepID=UPI0032DFC6FD
MNKSKSKKTKTNKKLVDSKQTTKPDNQENQPEETIGIPDIGLKKFLGCGG